MLAAFRLGQLGQEHLRGSCPATTLATMSRLLTDPARLPSERQMGTDSSSRAARSSAASDTDSVVLRTSMSLHMTSRTASMAASSLRACS